MRGGGKELAKLPGGGGHSPMPPGRADRHPTAVSSLTRVFTGLLGRLPWLMAEELRLREGKWFTWGDAEQESELRSHCFCSGALCLTPQCCQHFTLFPALPQATQSCGRVLSFGPGTSWGWWWPVAGRQGTRPVKPARAGADQKSCHLLLMWVAPRSGIKMGGGAGAVAWQIK